MKIWIKLLVGIIIGAAIGYYAPDNSESVLSFVSTVVISIGRYVLFPLVLFSTAAGTFELRRDKKTFRVLARTLVYLLVTSLLLSALGAVSVVLMVPERIPIVIAEEAVHPLPTFQQVITEIFPRNLFQVFNDSGNFLLPVFFFAMFLGLNLTFDRLLTRPAVQLIDSMSRVFYHMNSFILEIMGLGAIALSAYLVFDMTNTPQLPLFTQLLIVLSINSGVVIFGLYPGLLYLLSGKRSPYRWLYAVIAPALVAAASGDSYFSLGSLMKIGKESFGVPRKVGAVAFPLFTLFGRAGTALVTSASFVVVVNSYSSLGISIPQLVWIVLMSFATSFTLGSVPGIGALVSLALLSSSFGSGYEQGYLILKPVAPLLLSFGVMLDVVTAAFATMLVARHEGVQEEIEVKEFI